MAVELKAVRINNFKTFQAAQVDLPQSNGLYQVAGLNKMKVDDESNGAGKSSFFDSICWALYGKTAKGRKAGALLNRKSTGGYSVELDFGKDKIFRSWGPIKLQLNGVSVGQEEIEKLVGLTYEQFVLSVYLPQVKESGFIDLSPSKKLDFLSTVFELDKWVTYAEYAKKKYVQTSQDEAILQQKLASTEAQIDYISNSRTTTTKQIADWEKQEAEAVLILQQKLDAKKAEVVQDLPEDADLVKHNTALKNAKNSLDAAITKARKETSTLATKRSLLQNEIKQKLAQMQRLTDTAGGECPTCLQGIPEVHVLSACAPLLAGIDASEIQLAEIATHLMAQEEFLTNLESGARDNEGQQAELQEQIQAVALLRDQNLRHGADILALESHLATRPACPYTAQLTTQTADLETYKKQLDSIKTDITAVNTNTLKYEYWAKRFSMIRLAILDQIIDGMEVHFNQALANLDMAEWSVKLETERELKNESIKKELTITLFDNGEKIEIDDLSGGEMQRLRLATAIGVAELIKSRKQCDWPLWLLDEPSAGLSAPAVRAMISFLQGVSEFAQVYLSDHRMLDAGRFDGLISIVKGTDGVSSISCDKVLAPV